MFGARIVIVDTDVDYRKKLRGTLVRAGYFIAEEAGDGRSGLKAVFQTEPDLVIMGAKLPGAEGLEIARIIDENRIAPVILLINSYELELLEGVNASWFFACLVKPVSDTQLLLTIEIAVNNFKKLVKLEEENKKLKQALEERKLVERAKGLIMDAKGLSEREAYKYLQKLSMDNCIPLARIARRVISSFSKHS